MVVAPLQAQVVNREVSAMLPLIATVQAAGAAVLVDILIKPLISNFACGVVVPIPTLPEEVKVATAVGVNVDPAVDDVVPLVMILA